MKIRLIIEIVSLTLRNSFKILYIVSRYYNAYRNIDVWDGQTMLELPKKPFKEAMVEMLGISCAAVRHYEVDS